MEKFRYMAIAILVISCQSWADQNQPTSEGGATLVKEESPTELVLRLGNESNPVDGVLGPLTYGLRGTHKFENSFSLEAGYIRLHEPNTPLSNSVLDEAQGSIHFPETNNFDVSATLWKNRTIDMYTNLIGVEVARKSQVTLMIGGYLGTATLEDASRNFEGVQVGASSTLKEIDLGGACLFGKIEKGFYRKCGIDAAKNFFEEAKMPLTLSFSIESRKFDFGEDGPVSEPKDEFIFITAAELHLEKLIIKSK